MREGRQSTQEAGASLPPKNDKIPEAFTDHHPHRRANTLPFSNVLPERLATDPTELKQKDSLHEMSQIYFEKENSASKKYLSLLFAGLIFR